MIPVTPEPGRHVELVREALAHADSLYRLARRLTGSATDAEDLVQDTYARALGAWDSFTIGTNVRAWLYRILRNAHIDLLRRRRIDPLFGRLDAEASAGPEFMVGLGQATEPDQLRHLMVSEVEAVLNGMPEDARTVILLDLEGLTETEVADVMTCSVGTVKSRLSRARATLRGRLQQYARKEV